MTDQTQDNDTQTQEPGGNPPATDVGGQTPAGYVTQAVYAGLQKASQKKAEENAKQITELTTRLETLTTELEALKLEKGVSESSKETIEKAKQALEAQLGEMQVSQQRVERQLSQQTIVLKEFPVLAPLAEYIPHANTDDEFRTSAKNFQTALEAYVKQEVRTTLEGSGPTLGSGDDKRQARQSTIDTQWDTVNKLAGVPGKEADYNKEYAKLLEMIKE